MSVKPRCPRCGGRLTIDPRDELDCTNCGYTGGPVMSLTEADADIKHGTRTRRQAVLFGTRGKMINLEPGSEE